jgi:hypothetical protein
MRLCDLDKHRPITLKESEGFLGMLSESGGVGLVVKGVNTTPDVKPGEISRQARKMGFRTSANGVPPTANTNGSVSRPSQKKTGAIGSRLK